MQKKFHPAAPLLQPQCSAACFSSSSEAQTISYSQQSNNSRSKSREPGPNNYLPREVVVAAVNEVAESRLAIACCGCSSKRTECSVITQLDPSSNVTPLDEENAITQKSRLTRKMTFALPAEMGTKLILIVRLFVCIVNSCHRVYPARMRNNVTRPVPAVCACP